VAVTREAIREAIDLAPAAARPALMSLATAAAVTTRWFRDWAVLSFMIAMMALGVGVFSGGVMYVIWRALNHCLD
jgi:hypothetical protein